MVQSSTRGRASSWIAVAVMIVAFAAAGLGLVLGQLWLLIAGAVVFVIGGLFGLATGIMSDVH
jgi:hypothetical protein